MTVNVRACTVAPILALVLLGAAPAKKPAATKEQKVHHLLELTGAKQMQNRIVDAMLAQLSQRGDVPPGFAERFRALAQQDDLLSRIVPVYVAHLDDADLDGILAFYASKAGQDLAKAQPLIQQESMEIGQKWGAEIAERAMNDTGTQNAPAK